MRASAPLCQHHMFTWGNAEWNVSLALWAVKSRFRNIETAERAWGKRLCCVLLTDWLTSNWLDLGLELWWDVVDVLRANQNASPLVSSLLQASLTALSNSSSHNVDFIVGELTDVLADSVQKASCTQVIIHLHEALSQLVRVDVQKALVQFVRNAHVWITDVFERIQ